MTSKLQSQAILEALKSKLKCPIRYFCQVTHVGISDGNPFQEPVIFCLGEHSMFLLDRQMKDVQGEIYYAHIIMLVEQDPNSKGQMDVMRIEINDDRPAGIPAKITVISSEKNNLLKHLRCYWETDYMWRVSKYALLRVDQEFIDMRKYKTKKTNANEKNIFSYFSNNPSKEIQKGYTYICPDFMKKERLAGEFKGSDDEINYFLKVIIEDPVQLEFIKDDLRSKTEQIAESLMGTEEKFTIVKNAPYLRKMNLLIDWASWKGWSVVLKKDQNYTAVIVLRRKFIPPLVDTGQDFIFITNGGKNALKVSSEPADSIFTNAITSELYQEILISRCNALIMDEETCDFFRVQLKMEPENKALAYLFIRSILRIISHDHKQTEQQKLISEIEARNDFRKEDAELDPCHVIEKFVNVYSGKNETGVIKWKEKVCRYLAYAVDGGLFQSRFTLEDVIKCAKDGSLRDISQLSTLKRCIKLLLHIRKLEDTPEDKNQGVIPNFNQSNSEDLYEPISILLKDCKNRRYDSKRWTFNEKVMIALIETSYLQRELDISGDVNVYPSLLIHLLQNPYSSIELKSAICRVTVNIDDSGDINIFKQLIPYFLKIFKDKNYQLATQAAISLINLTHSNRENKQTIFKERKTIISRLSTRDKKLLSYTIFILNNLATETSRRKVIANEVREPLCKIIKGDIIELDFLSPEVLNNVYLALITITSKDHISIETHSGQTDLIQASINHLERFEDEVPNVCWFLELLAERTTTKRNLLGQILIEPLVKMVQSDINQDLMKNIFTLLKVLLQTPENLKLAKNTTFFDLMKKIALGPENYEPSIVKIAKYILRVDRHD